MNLQKFLNLDINFQVHVHIYQVTFMCLTNILPYIIGPGIAEILKSIIT